MRKSFVIISLALSVSALSVSVFNHYKHHQLEQADATSAKEGDFCESPGLIDIDCLNGTEVKCPNGTHVYKCGKDFQWHLIKEYVNGTDRFELELPLEVIPGPVPTVEDEDRIKS